MERIISQGWSSNKYSGLSVEVSNRLNTLKQEGYELVIKPKLSIGGSTPEPDLLFIKKIGNQYNFNNCVYIDNKYFYDVAFTPAQNKIVNAFSSTNQAITTVEKTFEINGFLVTKGTVIKIQKVEVFTIDNKLQLSNIVKKP
jgi:hypothetical protein